MADNNSILRSLIAYNKYGAYCVPLSSSHRPAAQMILSSDIYEPQTIEYMRANCKSGDIVHAGTYFGDFLPALSSGLAENSLVWAFEPNPENFRCAKITLELNDIQNIKLQNAGLGAKQEQLHIQTKDIHGQSLGGASRVISDAANINVPLQSVNILTIDDTVPSDREIAILQLDVEGHEQQALSGALLTIKRCRPIIILEVWPNSPLLASDWFAKNITALGYQQTGQLHGNIVFACKA